MIGLLALRAMTGHPLLALALLAQTPAEPEPPIMIDGAERPYLREISSTFHCQRLRVRLGYREEWISLGEVASMAQAHRVTLVELSVPGRSFSRADRERMRALFASMAWIERIDMRCFYGSIDLTILAMPKSDWVGYFQENRSDSHPIPRASLHSIHISRTNAVRIEAPEPIDFSAPAERRPDPD